MLPGKDCVFGVATSTPARIAAPVQRHATYQIWQEDSLGSKVFWAPAVNVRLYQLRFGHPEAEFGSIRNPAAVNGQH